MKVLTKTRFKLGLECPNKLYYTGKTEEYANPKSKDLFLIALADGGFQVEELARLHYPEGILIEDKKDDKNYDYLDKVQQTNELLKLENVVIFEAAFIYENLFIRVDIIEKIGNKINLIEVKAKSFKKGEDDIKFDSSWKFYLFDVAFQKYVIEKSNPEYIVTPFLMLADKNKTTTIDKLNQLFRISKKSNNRTGVIKKIDSLQNPDEESVLSVVDVSSLTSKIELGEYRILKEYAFEDAIHLLSKAYKEDRFFDYDLQFQTCKTCEFKSNEKTTHLKDGFRECFKKKLNWNDYDFDDPTAFEIWDFRRLNQLSKSGVIKLVDVCDDEFGERKDSEIKMSRVVRQLTQKYKTLKKDNNPEIFKDSLIAEMGKWKFPLNFIDFEASTAPLPYFAGQHPYEKVVFQFSHHIYHEDGRIEHANQYINLEAGVFPNFYFVRHLKLALEQNDGTVFQYSPYENSTLNQVKVQLENSKESDREQLISFIKTLTTPPSSQNYKGERWKPTRGMVDLCVIIKDYYYNPFTKGSNSIKSVLPAIFKSSQFIKEKYSKNIEDINVSSKNFETTKVWLKLEDRIVLDPYKSLDKPFLEWDESFERVSEITDINNGGAAMTAYGLTQYHDMTEMERNKIKDALLRYCELDTLAMVMIYEHLKEICEL